MFLYPIKGGTPRNTVKNTKLFNTINIRMDLAIDKVVSSNNSSSPIIRFIRDILHRVSNPEYLTMDIFDVYDDVVGLAQGIEITFDFIRRQNPLQNNILMQKGVREYIIPTSGIIGTDVSPFDPWDKWANINPVVLAAHDSTELNIVEHTLQFTFNNNVPEYP
jgi:hypothetical protein